MDVDLHQRSQNCIAQGALTNSKRPESFVKGVYPTHVNSGVGCHLTDSKGKRYIDFICGLGSNLLGYANHDIAEAVLIQMSKGVTLSLATRAEIDCAEKLKECIPFIDAVKFLKTGTEACMAAVRIARAYTGRSFVLSEGYHGHGDEFISLTPPAAGVPKWPDDGLHNSKPMGTLKSLSQIGSGCAAVIVEPISTDLTPERIEWLKDLRERCTKHGVILIFDEIITGFRFPKFSVSQFLGITPDLICLGKAMGGGFPLAAVGGKYAIMNQPDYFVSSTFAGEGCSLAAGVAFMTALQKRFDIKQLWDFGQKWIDNFNAATQANGLDLRLRAYPTRGVFEGDPLVKALFMQEACRSGILFGPSWFLSFSHMNLNETYMQTIREILCQIKLGKVSLKGQMPQSPFSQKVRNQ